MSKLPSVTTTKGIFDSPSNFTSMLFDEEYLQRRSRRDDKQAFLEAIDKVPDVDPDESDRI